MDENTRNEGNVQYKGHHHHHHHQHHHHQQYQQVCRHFARQKCNYGDACRFSHDPKAVEAYLANGGDFKQGYNQNTQPHRRKIVITGLPPHWTTSDTGSYFTQFGSVQECEIVMPGKALLSFHRNGDTENVVAHAMHLPPIDGVFKLQVYYDAPHSRVGQGQQGQQGQDMGGLMEVVQMLQSQEPDVLTNLRDQLLELVQKDQAGQSNVTYILLKASAHDDLTQSVEHEVWHVDQPLVTRINQLFTTSPKVVIIFSVRGRNHYSGYAELSSQAAVRSSFSHLPPSLPLSWEHIIGVQWKGVGMVDFARLPSVQAASMPDGHSLSPQDGAAICKLIQEAPSSFASTSTPANMHSKDDVDIASMGYDDYLQLCSTKKKEHDRGTPAD
eukprot:TRINITY_DN4215_c0_g1_i1.p1 TRINITY_DN4215_c0_g1~~TRINITY_DN4215_c0_g1_i1.p1  ORF type:complete len:397 (+),score=56.68 TRINITY_DN4215_c0_g1_i1:39-1193(+)